VNQLQVQVQPVNPVAIASPGAGAGAGAGPGSPVGPHLGAEVGGEVGADGGANVGTDVIANMGESTAPELQLVSPTANSIAGDASLANTLELQLNEDNLAALNEVNSIQNVQRQPSPVLHAPHAQLNNLMNNDSEFGSRYGGRGNINDEQRGLNGLLNNDSDLELDSEGEAMEVFSPHAMAAASGNNA
tara:strand:- start:5142 stop:5705 length:564 start_codon:yes stop_codon:yes gene_type:complete